MTREEREEIDRYNASYHDLPMEVMPRFNELSAMPIRDLPPDLAQMMKSYADKYMLCTEVLLMAIADYLKTNKKEFPVHLL